MFFASDNWAGVHPAIAANLAAHSDGFSVAYSEGALDNAVYDRFGEIFEREVAVFFVATGTAANTLALSAYDKPGGVAFSHREAHLIADECGAFGYISGGSRLHGIDGTLGRMDLPALEQALARFTPDSVHGGRAMAVSLTQSTEIGTLYSLDDIAAVSALAKRHDLPLHMDGARFANALVALDVSPAEMTWKRGVDIVSFGGTKNGCWCAEAIVMFDLDRARDLAFMRMRAGQLFSKSRFVAAQFEAYLRDGLWLETARHSNTMAAALAVAVEQSGVARLAWRPEANEVFAIMRKADAERLRTAGAVFHQWPSPHGFTGAIAGDEALYRFVTSFATTASDVEQLGTLIT